MRICKYCGNKYHDRAFTCEGCGAPLPAPVVTAASKASSLQKRKNFAFILLCILLAASMIIYINRGKFSDRFQDGGETEQQSIDIEAYGVAYENYFRQGKFSDFEGAVCAAPGISYIPPLVNRFLIKNASDTPSYLQAAAALRDNGYDTDALRVLSSGYKRTGDTVLMDMICQWWPMPCNVSSTFSYFDPLARMMGKTWDALTWEDALRVKFIHISDSFMGVSFEERGDYADYASFLPTVRYEYFTAADVESATGFHTSRYKLAEHMQDMADGTYRQAEEDLSAAMGVFMNTTFLMVDRSGLVPSSVMARLPNLCVVYSWQYCDFAADPYGYTDLYAPLATLDDLKVLGGGVPMTGMGLFQIEEIDLCSSPRYSRYNDWQLIYEDGQLVYEQAETSKGRFENLNWRAAFTEDKTLYLSGLHAFDRLQKLTISWTGDVEQTETLANLPALRSLTLENCFITQNVTEIARLAALEELRLRNTPLENYEFISQMENLRILEIEGETKWEVSNGTVSQVQTGGRYLPDVSGLANLTELYVSFSGVEGLESLTGLQRLGITYLQDLTVLSGMTELRHLKVDRCDDLTGIENLPDLEALQIAAHLPENTEILASAENLCELVIIGLSPADCAAILRNTGELNSVMLNNFPNSTGVGEMCEVLGEKTSLTELYIIPVNPMLDKQPLIIEGDRINLEDLTPPPNGVIIDMQKYSVELIKLINIKKLRLQNVGLRSIDFTASMSNLEWLHISDNLITDLSPLSGLQKLREVDISGNLCTWGNIRESLSGGTITATVMH